MNSAIIIHGTGGHPEENWFPWLQRELREYDYNVIIPQFPTPNHQNPEHWWRIFKNYKQFVNENTILIGHSCGGAFLLRVLETLSSPVKTSVFVAASAGIKPIKYYEVDRPFVEKPFEWKTIRKNSKHFLVFHSQDDPFICIENGELIAKNVHVPLVRLTNAGHFNAAAGYTTFELLLEKLRPWL